MEERRARSAEGGGETGQRWAGAWEEGGTRERRGNGAGDL